MHKPTKNGWPQSAGRLLMIAALALAAGADLQAADVTVTGVLKDQYYKDATRATLANGTAALTSTSALNAAQAPSNIADNYAQRVSGWFTPTVTGNYVFFTASDDDSDLFVSTDATPAKKRLVAQQNTWGNPLEWITAEGGAKTSGADVTQKRSEQFTPDAGVTTPYSAGISLTAGTRYYIEGVHHEGGGGDNFAATFKLLSAADPTNGQPSALTGNLISAAFANPTSLTISTPPVDAKVPETAPASFSVGIATDSELTPIYQWRKNGVDIPGATGAKYTFQAQSTDNGAKYSVVVKTPALTGLTVLTATSLEAKLQVDSAISLTGSLKHEFYAGGSRASVEAGTAGEPTYTELLSKFETGVNIADNYANRVSGYFTPATTGSYVFFVASDDDSDLFLSTDNKPANKRLIAQQNTWGNNLEWVTAESGAKVDGPDVTQKRSDQWTPDAGVTTPFAAGIALTKGTKYYIEGVHHDGGGGDNFSVTFKLLAEPDPVNATVGALIGDVISTLVPKGEITISKAPVAINTIEGRRATFTVAATATGVVKPTFQWQKNNVDIPGATSASHTTATLSLGDGGSYRVKISAPGTEVFTTPVALVVAKDTLPPAIVSVGALNHPGGVNVGVIFDEVLANPASLALANFKLSAGTVTSATYIDNSSGYSTLDHGVLLNTTGLVPGNTYTLTVKDVVDLKGNKMASTAVQFTVQKLTWAALGTEDPAFPASAIGVGADGVNLQNGGSAFWSTNDDVTFAYEEITGDFDKVVQIEDHDAASNWSRAGLMVRETLDGTGAVASRYQAIHADPAPIKFDGTPSNNQWENNRRHTTGGATDSASGGSGAPVYPNVWVRLRRQASVVHVYRSPDGVTWTQMARTDFAAVGDLTPLPAKMFVGIVLGAENGNITPDTQRKLWTARFRHYGDHQPNKVAGKQTYSIGASFGDDTVRGSIGPTEVAGIDAVAQAHWMSIPGGKSDVSGPIPLVANVNGVAQVTTATVEWDSNNTWASTGLGEENNGFTGSDRALMSGYLDTGNATTTTITVKGLPTQLTSGKYDLVVYALGGVAARGGGFRVTDLNGAVLKDYVVVLSPLNPGTFKEVAPVTPGTPTEGTYIVFGGLSAKDIIIDATTANGQGQSGTPRAPVNAIQFVSPIGLLTAVVVTPTISISGDKITFKGKLQSADTLTGTFGDVMGATSPFPVTATAAQKFYRASK